MKAYIRWMIRRDMAEVLAIEDLHVTAFDATEKDES